MYIFGDVHGDIIRMQQFVHLATVANENMLFLGDFLDSYEYDPYDQIKCIDFALQLAEEKRAIVIRGNHEMSYLNSLMVCSGWNAKTNEMLLQDRRKQRMMEFFATYIHDEEHKILYTHAGMNALFANINGINVDNISDKLRELNALPHKQSPLYQAGHARGGAYLTGGILWSDWNQEFKPIDGLRQVFGHTHLRNGIENVGDNYNIDTVHKDQFLHYDEPNDAFIKMTL